MRTPPALVRLALALVLCVLAGVAMAGVAFPVVAGIGLAGKSAADEFEPEKPPALVLPQRTKIVDIKGNVIATLFTENRVNVALDRVPMDAREALIAIEDSRFYEHNGIDVKGTLRALARNTGSGSVQQGGSTLTQQYVKNLLIETAATEEGQKAAVQKSYARKLQEARYARYLEQHMSKDEILEGYLNIAYYGDGVYGIGAAANHFFGRPVPSLTLTQSATLAGMVQNPARFDPIKNPQLSKARRNLVLDRMLELGYITTTEHTRASAAPLGAKAVGNAKSGCEAATTAPFFCDYVRRYLEDGPAGKALGRTRQERQERLLSGGLTIHTTLDPDVQAAAQKAVDDQVPRNDPTDGGFDAAAVANTVEPGTGNIKAMAVDRGFGSGKGETKVNLAIGGSLGFQGGSTFKTFVLASALDKGIPPSLTLFAPQSYCPKAFVYKLDDGGCPGNAGDSETGTFDMVKATWDSVNTYYIQLEERTGLDDPPLLAEQLGIRQVTSDFEGGSLNHYPSFVLGSANTVSPLAMAGAYAAFAAEGRFCAPRPVAKITDSLGKEVPLDNPECRQVLERDVANKVTSILRGVIERGGTGASARIGRPAAGKTGTTNSSKAAWFIGYTPQLSTAVWVGKPVPTNMRNITINGRGYKQVYGGTVPAAIWRQLMSQALQGYPAADFPDASLATSNRDLTTVPDVTGLTLAAAEAQLRSAGFGVATGTAVRAAPVPAGGVAYTTPAAGARVPRGITITLVPSNGLPPLATATPTRSANPRPTGKPKPTKSPEPSTPPSPTPSPTKKGNGP